MGDEARQCGSSAAIGVHAWSRRRPQPMEPRRRDTGETDAGPDRAECRTVGLGGGEPAPSGRDEASLPHEPVSAATVHATGLQLRDGVEAHRAGQAGRFDHAGQRAG